MPQGSSEPSTSTLPPGQESWREATTVLRERLEMQERFLFPSRAFHSPHPTPQKHRLHTPWAVAPPLLVAQVTLSSCKPALYTQLSKPVQVTPCPSSLPHPTISDSLPCLSHTFLCIWLLCLSLPSASCDGHL